MTKRIKHYEIEKVLGAGAMGKVYLAYDLNLQRPVAIKRLLIREDMEDHELKRAKEQFISEARTTGMLSHPDIVTIYSLEKVGDSYFIIMEYVDGLTLRQFLRTNLLNSEQILSFMRKLCGAMQFAHSMNVIHMDLKPDNIFIKPKGEVKVADFGIAKVTKSAYKNVEGAIHGTPVYMSPEHLQGLDIDWRTDIYALGIILYEALTGNKPFSGSDMKTTIDRILNEQVPSVTEFRHDIIADIDEIIAKATEKNREERYQSALQLSIELENAIFAKSVSSFKSFKSESERMPTEIREERKEAVLRASKLNESEGIASPSRKTPFRAAKAMWKKMSSPVTCNLYAISAIDSSHIWAVGDGGTIVFFDGNSWNIQESGTGGFLLGISALDPNHVWAVGKAGTALFYNGISWQKQETGISEDLCSVTALDAENVWAAGDNGTIIGFDGKNWGVQVSGTKNRLHGISAFSNDYIWAVGTGRTILFCNGFFWNAVDCPIDEWLWDVALGDTGRVWFAGETGTLVSYDSEGWHTYSSGKENQLRSIYALDSKNIWAVGDNGNVCFYNGILWKPQASSTSQRLYAVTSFSKEKAWATGSDGTIIEYSS